MRPADRHTHGQRRSSQEQKSRGIGSLNSAFPGLGEGGTRTIPSAALPIEKGVVGAGDIQDSLARWPLFGSEARRIIGLPFWLVHMLAANPFVLRRVEVAPSATDGQRRVPVRGWKGGFSDDALRCGQGGVVASQCLPFLVSMARDRDRDCTVAFSPVRGQGRIPTTGARADSPVVQ